MHGDEKILKYKLCRAVDPCKNVPDLNCEIHDLLLDVVDLKQEVPDLRSRGIPANLTPVFNMSLTALLFSLRLGAERSSQRIRFIVICTTNYLVSSFFFLFFMQINDRLTDLSRISVLVSTWGYG